MMRPGALLPSTMAVGFLWQALGVGYPPRRVSWVLLMSARCTPPLLLPGSGDPILASVSASVSVCGGFAAGVNVGWFPLGPREVFVPSYAVSRAYVNRVNISNTTVNETVVNNYYNTTVVNRNVNVNNVRYVNQSVPGAVTATSPHAFTSAQPVSRNLVAVDQREVASAPVGVSAPSVTPPKQAVMGSGAATNVRPPAALANRSVVAKTTPPPPSPSFEKQQAAIQANHGQPISMAQTRQIQPARTAATTAPVKIAPSSTPTTPRVNAVHGQNNTNRPSNAAGAQTNPAGKSASTGAHNDRPPSARPPVIDNDQLEQKHQQELEQLHQKQDQERQQLEQQQYQAQQKLQTTECRRSQAAGTEPAAPAATRTTGAEAQ